MALFTGKGDGGTTKLFDTPAGERVTKAAGVFEALGALDELNASVGLCRAAAGEHEVSGSPLHDLLLDVQHHLFTLQAEIAGAGKCVPEEGVERMGALIERIETELPPITTFLVPGATELSARLDAARACARRAERRLVALHDSGERELSPASRAYANRLSSLLYALTRLVNHRAGAAETPPRYL